MTEPERPPERTQDLGLLDDLTLVPVGILLLIGYLTPLSDLQPDPRYYFMQAGRVLAGLVPYRDFSFEYPPLALVPMILPRLWPTPIALAVYEWTYLLENALLLMAIALVVAWLADRGWSIGRPERALVSLTILVIAIAPVMAWRYDIFPTLLTIIGIALVAADRPGTAGVALGLGALAKLYPAVLVPLLVVRYVATREMRPAVRLAVGFGLTVGAAVAVALVVAGPSAVSFLGFQGARGLQVESVMAGLVLLSHVLAGLEASVRSEFLTFQVSSPLASTLSSIQLPLLVILYALFLVAAWWAVRTERDRLGTVRGETVLAFSLAALLLFMTTNKVLSPQHLVWILPFVALRPRREVWWVTVAYALTVFIYPLNYTPLLKLDPGMVTVLNVRNLMLVGLLAWLVASHLPVGPWRSREDASVVEGNGEATSGAAA